MSTGFDLNAGALPLQSLPQFDIGTGNVEILELPT
jgi:hypothetical protein